MAGSRPEEYQRGGPRVFKALSHAAWSTRFGGDPSLVGKPVRLEAGDPFVVVGVMPAGVELRLFHDSTGATAGDVNLDAEAGSWTRRKRARGGGFWNVLGRLRPDVSVD